VQYSAKFGPDLTSLARLYEQYCLIQVTCNMNAKGQTWNEDIWTVTRPNKKSPS